MLATSGSFWIALVVSTFVIALLSAAIQVTTLRPLLGRDPLTTILATFGVQLDGILPRRAHQLSDPRLPLVLDLSLLGELMGHVGVDTPRPIGGRAVERFQPAGGNQRRDLLC